MMQPRYIHRHCEASELDRWPPELHKKIQKASKGMNVLEDLRRLQLALKRLRFPRSLMVDS